MGDKGPATLQDLLQKRDFPALIKRLDAQLRGGNGEDAGVHLPLQVNRAICYQQLGIYRKALKDTEDVLAAQPSHGAALLLLAKIFVGMKNSQDAKKTLVRLLEATDNGTVDLFTAAEAQEMLTALENGTLKPGTKIPMLRGSIVPSAPAQRTAPSPAAATMPPQQITPEQPKGATSPSQPAPKENTQAPISPKGSTPPSEALTVPATTAHSPPAAAAAAAQLQPMHRLVTMTDPASAINVAVNLVNNGQNAEAIAMLDLLIERHGRGVAPLAARGTARALQGDLTGAVEDFNAAIAGAPNESDFYKRRAQALGALGRDAEALDDLIKARECSADPIGAAEALGDAARIHHKRRDYHRAELNLRAALDLNPSATNLLPLLASSQVSQGDLAEGVATYAGLMEAGYKDVDAVINLGMAQKELCHVEDAERTLRRAARLGQGTTAEVTAHRLLAQMLQGLGNHLGAVRELDAGLQAATTEAQKVELRFLRGACHHAIGLHRLAIEDYQRTLEASPDGLSQDAVAFMCLSFYQKEMALWCRAHLDDPIKSLCLDADLHPEFKELWCKKTPPGSDFVAMYHQIMQPQQPNWDAPPPQPRAPQELINALVTAADALGAQVQYHHQGFLPNKRQRRMAGLAAIEYAQLLVQAAAARREGRPLPKYPDVGASSCARGRSGIGGGGRGGPGSHPMGWRDAMELLVKWRQVAEPNDQVLWVDLLTEREFSSGFGSHTPMFTGQTKCVRYYMNFDRALQVAKKVALSNGEVYDAQNKPVKIDGARATALAEATTAEEYWKAVGKDSWVVVPVESTTREGHIMEGTRLTVVNFGQREREAMAAAEGQTNGNGKGGGEYSRDSSSSTNRLEGPTLDDEGLAVHGVVPLTVESINGTTSTGTEKESDHEIESDRDLSTSGIAGPATSRPTEIQPHSFEFSIRTPVTPARWQDYDEELKGVFDNLLQALADGDKGAAATAALRFAYYWYNFMPLARGSALCGYVSILGAFLAAGMPIRATIPVSVQTDWEAILQSSPGEFIAGFAGWMLPPELNGHGGVGGNEAPWPCRAVEELPHVREVLATMRERLNALNGKKGPRI